MKTLALKYPMMAGKVKGMKTLDKLVLMKNLRPIFVDNDGAGDSSSSRMQDSAVHGRSRDEIAGEVRMRGGIHDDDYMGDPIAKEVLRFYEDRDTFLQMPRETSERLPAFEHFPGAPRYRESL